MKEIKLTQGQFALVDDADYDWLNQWKWHAHKSRQTYYAERQVRINLEKQPQKQKSLSMHRLIMNTSKGMEVDHIDHNGLNCQKHNMRNCTTLQNQMNRKSRGRSKYLGVSYFNGNKFRADIRPAGYKTIHLGLFDSEIEAAIAYDKEAVKHYGEFANLNFK